MDSELVLDKQMATTSVEASLDSLVSKSNVFLSAHGLSPLTPGVLGQLETNLGLTLQMLSEVTTHPLSFDPSKWLSSGTLEKAAQDIDADSSTARLYLRFLEFSSPRQAQLHLDSYSARYPADVVFSSVLNERLSTLPADSPVRVPYAGISCATSGQGREDQDQQQQEATRRANFCQGMVMDVFEIPLFNKRLNSPMQWRTDPELSNRETFLRALLGSAALNSAFGGLFPRVSLPPSIPFITQEINNQLHRESRQYLAEDRRTTAKPTKLVQHVREEKQIWHEIHGKQGTEEGHAVIDRLSEPAHLLPDGTYLSLHQLKDIPRECLQGSAAFWTDQAGPGPQYSQHLWAMLGQLLNVSIQRAILDFWVRVTRHFYYWLACVFCSRFLYISRPKVIMLESSKVPFISSFSTVLY